MKKTRTIAPERKPAPLAEPKPFSAFASDRGENLLFEPGQEAGYRTIYQHDLDRIVYSKPFRRMAYKSQLITAQDDHARTRLIHTLEVARISIEISKALGLNTTLTEAIAQGHDLGHCPFGAAGKQALETYLLNSKKGRGQKNTNRFCHDQFGGFLLEVASQRVFSRSHDASQYSSLNQFELLDPKTVLAISPEVLDGIEHHTMRPNSTPKELPRTLEGQVVRIADNFAYITQDLEDARALGISFPQYANMEEYKIGRSRRNIKSFDRKFAGVELLDLFHEDVGRRLNVMIHRFVEHNKLRMKKLREIRSPFLRAKIPILEIDHDLQFLLDFTWEQIIVLGIHNNHRVKTQWSMAKQVVLTMRELLDDDISKQDPDLLGFMEKYSIFAQKANADIKCWYVASMTDRFLQYKLQQYFRR